MIEKVNVKIKRLDPQAVIPSFSKPGDAGQDMTATSIEITENYIEYDTSISMEIPTGYVGLLFPRSSISKYDLILANSVAVIDSGYRGSIKFRFKRSNYNKHYPDDKNYEYSVNKANIYNIGDKIGQIMILPYPQIEFTEVSELSDTERGNNGFGSSGK